MKLSQAHNTLGSTQVPGDIFPGVLIGIVGLLSFVISIISCICCSKRSNNDRRLSSYSSVKDTVQLEDLLSKPVLEDPESVFSEPSIYCNRTPSVSNKSPSGDSDARPRSQLCSDSESEHFLFPNSPNKKPFPDEHMPSSLPSTSQFLKREAVSMKQKSSPRGSRKSNRDKKKPVSDKSTLGGQSSDNNVSRPISPEQASIAGKAINPPQASLSGKDATLSVPSSSQENKNVTTQLLDLNKLERDTPGSYSKSTGNTEHSGKDPEIKTDKTERKLHAEVTSIQDDNVLENANQDKLVLHSKERNDTIPSDVNIPTSKNDGSTVSRGLLSSKNSQPIDKDTKEKDNVDTACESTFINNKTKQMPLGKLKLTETPGLHNIIANPGSSRLRNAREKNLKTCEPNHQQSILTPGRCSFSHEAGHTANGNSKIISPLINMSPVQERRLLSEGSESASPVTSPSPIDSPHIFQQIGTKAPAIDFSNPSNGSEIKENDTLSNSQKQKPEQYNGNLPIQIAARVDGPPSSNFQTSITPTRVKKSDNVSKSDRAPLRRSVSEETAKPDKAARDVKTVSVNLQIDFHFQNTGCVQTNFEKPPSTLRSLKNTPNNREPINKPPQQNDEDKIKATNKNMWLNLGKSNQSSVNNDNEVLELKHKRQILEKSFAEKSVVEDTDFQVSTSRKRRSEPLIATKTSLEKIPIALFDARSLKAFTTFSAARNSGNGKRSVKYRRSYAAGEKLQLHSTGRNAKKVTERKAVEHTIRPFDSAGIKRQRFHSSEDLTDIHDSTVVKEVQISVPITENFKDSKEVSGFELDKQKPHDGVDDKDTKITKKNSKGVKIHIETERGCADKLLSTKETPEKEYRRTKKKTNKRRKTIPAGISSELISVSIRELSRSDPVIFKAPENSDMGLSSPKPNLCHGSLDKCISDYPSTLIGNIMKPTSRAKSPVPKPRPKPRTGVAANTLIQSQSLERKTKLPIAKPRISKSMDKLNNDSEEDSNSVAAYSEEDSNSIATYSEQHLPTEVPIDSEAAPNTVDDSSNNNESPPPAQIVQEINPQIEKCGVGQSEAAQRLGEQVQSDEKPDGGCMMRKEVTKTTESTEKKSVPEIEVSDDSDYDNPWDSLDGAVQRASIRYNRRPSRIAAGEDTKTLLLQSAEDLGRLLEQAEKRRQLRQTAAKSSCPGDGNLLSPDREPPTSVPFTRFSPFRHTVKGLVSKPLSEASRPNDYLHHEFPSSRSGKYLKKNEMANRSQSLVKRHPQVQNTTVEDELIAFRVRKPKNFSPPTRPKSLSVKEASKTMNPDMKKRKY